MRFDRFCDRVVGVGIFGIITLVACLTFASVARGAGVTSPPAQSRSIFNVGPAASPTAGRLYPVVHLGGRVSLYGFDGNTLGNVSALALGLNATRTGQYPDVGLTTRETGGSTVLMLQTIGSGNPQVALLSSPSQAAGTVINTQAPVIGSTGVVIGGGDGVRIFGRSVTGAAVTIADDGGLLAVGRIQHNRACATGFVRGGVGLCIRNTTLTTVAVPTTCSLMPGIEGYNTTQHILVVGTTLAQNVLNGLSTVDVTIFADSGCTTSLSTYSLYSRELVALAGAAILAQTSAMLITHATSPTYIRAVATAGGTGAVYQVRAYND